MPIVDLAAVKAELGIGETDTSQDDVLNRVIAGAVQMVTDMCGPLEPVDVVEDQRYVHRTRDGRPLHHVVGEEIVLRQWPVVSVASVTLYPAGTVIPPLDITTGVEGWELDQRAGVITFSYPWLSRYVRIAYTAGRTVIPGTITDALQIIIEHLWRASKNRVGVGQRSVFGGADPEKTAPFPAGFAMPKRASELLAYEIKPDGIG